MINGQIKFSGRLFEPGRLDSDVDAVYKEQLTAAGLFFQGEVHRATPGYTGALQKGWLTKYSDSDHEVRVSNPLEYALPMEYGRRPGKGIPPEPLQLWVRRKLGVTNAETITRKGVKRLGYKAIAFLISRHAKTKGLKGKFFTRDTFKASVPTINQQFLGPIGAKLVERFRA